MNFLKSIVLLSFIMVLMGAWTGGTVRAEDISNGNPIEALKDVRYFRVYFDKPETAHEIVISMNTVETDYKKGFVIVEITTPDEFNRLVETKLKIKEIKNPLVEKIEKIRAAALLEATGIPGYPCYRTVEETFATGASIAANYPTLATWTDQGDSWEKVNGFGGYDLYVLKLTNSAIPGPKPKLFMSGAIHAREYTTAELLTRLAEYLVENYDVDADATWLLDHHEVHMMLHTNPDGRKYAESGYSWRKNTNQDYCSPTSSYRGADLNRNCEFKWDCCGGSSSYECDTTFHGAYAASEPETQALQNYMRSLFPDQRGPNDTDAAPLDATGVYFDIHASGELILWPWGWTSTVAPNGLQLQTFGRKMAYFNHHTPKQGIGLYPTDGTTKLFAYGELGIAGYTIELGTSFFQDCAYFESTILPDNLQALLYAFKVCRTPYMTPAGPDAANILLSAGSTAPGVAAGTSITITASINDTRYNNTNGTEPTQNAMAAEYYIDTPPWITSPTPVAFALSASDGSFNNPVEAVEGVIDTTGFSNGRHIVYVRGQDTDGNWGAFSAVFLYIADSSDTQPPTPDPMTWAIVPQASGPNSVIMTATTASDPAGVEYYFQCLTAGGHDSGWQDSVIYEDTGLVTGTPYTYHVKARDKSPNLNETAWSGSASATPIGTVPDAPSGLNVNVISCNELTLTWTDNSANEDLFKIERSPDGSNFSQIDTVGANVTNYNDTSVAENTTYWYRVLASNGTGDSGYSNTANGSTPLCPVNPPAAPSNLAAKPSKTSASLTWVDNAGNEDGFRIYWGTSPSSLSLVATVGANTTSYVKTGLTRKTVYYYKVCAYNGDGEGCTAVIQTKTK